MNNDSVLCLGGVLCYNTYVKKQCLCTMSFDRFIQGLRCC